MHFSHHADLFEDFCRPPSLYTSNTSTADPNNVPNNANGNGSTLNNNTGDPNTTNLPGYFLPFEEIHLPAHLMPLNPEDEDDVVPDMHAAFGITRALGQGGVGPGGDVSGALGAGAQRELVWRDLGLERLVEGGPSPGDRVIPNLKREGKRPGRIAMTR